jgi:hypothetical protein
LYCYAVMLEMENEQLRQNLDEKRAKVGLYKLNTVDP